MASKAAYKRLMKEYQMIQESPPPFITAKPAEKNILEWHYVITGPPESPYAGGEYHGKLIFPSDYPFKPPGIQMVTPNGRFKTNTRLCLSMSDFHPETWNPSWSVASILTGLLSFMLEETSTLGSLNASAHERQMLARQSFKWNREQNLKFKENFPDLYVKEAQEQPLPTLKSPSTPSPSTSTVDANNNNTNSNNSNNGIGVNKGNNKNKEENDDLILTELRLLMKSNLFRMFMGGLIVYFSFTLATKYFGPT